MTRKSATTDAVEETAIETTPQGNLTNEMSDAEIMAAINAEMAKNAAKRAAQGPRKVSIQELFQQSVALVASATGKRFRGDIPSVSEQTAVKIYELTLMWALNNRDTTDSGILAAEETERNEGPTGPDVINEIIGEPSPSTETE